MYNYVFVLYITDNYHSYKQAIFANADMAEQVSFWLNKYLNLDSDYMTTYIEKEVILM
jgi:hypothetical protein